MKKHHIKSDGGELDTSLWDDLTLRQKSDVMAAAVRNGITSLPEIRQKWNEFVEDGSADEDNLFKDGGDIPSKSIKDKITLWEGDSMRTNRSFEAEAKDFNRVIPQAIRDNLSQEQLDALYSYGYNVGMGNLKKRVLPALTNYVNGSAGAEDVASSMWASRDSERGMSGLRKRRDYERSQFVYGSPSDRRQSVITSALNMDLSSLPSGNNMSLLPPNPTDYGAPIDYSSLMRTASVEEQPTETEVRRNRLADFMNAFDLLEGTGNEQPLTGYTPSKKPAPFVVEAPVYHDTLLDNSWFAEGGALYDEDGEPHEVMYHYTLPEVEVRPKPNLADDLRRYRKMQDDYLIMSNDHTALGTPQNPHLKERGLRGANAPKGIFDGYDAVYFGVPGETMVGAYPSELVVPKPTNYKSLLGNNGNFDALNPNMFKALLPFTLGYSLYKTTTEGHE